MIRVLCVEDDAMARNYIASRLGMEPDIEVVAAVADPAAALECLLKVDVDVILLDYQLVGADGLQVLQSITWCCQAFGPGRRRPGVLFCTGWADAAFETTSRQGGASGVVAKEMAFKELVPAVRAVAAGGSWFGQEGPAVNAEKEPQSWRILVAEHERSTRTALEHSLAPIGCLLRFAWNGGEALRHLEAEAFDLLMLSPRLPGPPRVPEVLERVKTRWPGVRVLFLAPSPVEEDGFTPCSNVRGTISRPITTSRLREEVAQAVAAEMAARPQVQGMLGALERAARIEAMLEPRSAEG